MGMKIKALGLALALGTAALMAPGTAIAATPGVWVNNGTCANIQLNQIDNDGDYLYARIALDTGVRLRDLTYNIRRNGKILPLRLSARQIADCGDGIIQVRISGFLPTTLLFSPTLEVLNKNVFYASNGFNLID
ncbi:MAG: hypothetical protein ACKO27_04580 [Ilumatobacteraceae bacterium]